MDFLMTGTPGILSEQLQERLEDGSLFPASPPDSSVLHRDLQHLNPTPLARVQLLQALHPSVEESGVLGDLVDLSLGRPGVRLESFN